MKTPEVMYRDATHDPEAAARADRSPELRTDLLANGFMPIGLAEFRLSSQKPEAMPLTANPDLALLNDAAQNGEVDEVWTSLDQSAFAAIENSFGGPVVSIRTLMENGRVVETTMKPVRAPQIFPPSSGLPGGQDASSNLPMTLTLKLMQFGMGSLPLWAREDRPRAGYHVELVDTRDVGILWRRHQQHLQAVRQSDPARTRPHNLLTMYMAFNCRTMEIMEHYGKWGNRLSNGVFALFVLAIPLSMLLTFRWIDTVKTAAKALHLGDLLFLTPIFGMLVIAILTMILMGLIKTHITPRLPGPKLRPVAELLVEAQSRLRTEPFPTIQAPSRIVAQAPENTPRSLVRPPSAAWLGRNKPLMDRIITGLFMGAILGNTHGFALTTLGPLDILQRVGWNALLGAFSTFWMTSGVSFKNKVVTGALGGMGTTILLLFLPLEGWPRFFVSMILGGLVWVGIGWLTRRLK